MAHPPYRGLTAPPRRVAGGPLFGTVVTQGCSPPWRYGEQAVRVGAPTRERTMSTCRGRHVADPPAAGRVPPGSREGVPHHHRGDGAVVGGPRPPVRGRGRTRG